MRAWLVFVVLLVLVPIAAAEQEATDLFASDKLGIALSVSSDLTVQPKTQGAMSADYVQADLFFYPKDTASQHVNALTTSPEAERRGSLLRFVWDSPSASTLHYRADTQVDVRNDFPRVTQKIKFPLTRIAPEAQPYLAATEHIDSAYPGILTLANKLAQGKDDEFVVVSDIAIWTKNNINYTLSTLTADVSQKASWVLQNREGVCDELTSLFIAMLRALGIPARFVTGVAYTNSPLFARQWGAHGWAEVYFPDVGWVPFDPTFGEFGWVDPGHVTLITSDDPETPSTRFEWRGTNINVAYGEPDIDASITSVGQKTPADVALTVKPLYDTVGFGAYNLAEATVENLQPYYVTTEVRLARVKELEVFEPYDQQLVLKPFEKKTAFWRVKVADDLQERFVYSLPLGVYTVRNDSVTATFTAKAHAGEHSKVEVTRAMNTLSGDEAQVVSRTLELGCTSDKGTLYSDETASVACSLRNQGTTPLTNLRVCIEGKQCSALNLGIGQSRDLSFAQGFTSPGAATLFVTASNADVSRSVPVAFQMLDVPAVNITGVTYPATIAYGKPFTLAFTLKKASGSVPKNIVLTISVPSGSQMFEMPELPGEQAFQIDFNSAELGLGTTAMKITARYEDERGRKRTSTATAPVVLTTVPFYAKAWLWFRGLFE